MPQQEIRHARVQLFGAHGHGVQVGQNGAVTVRLGKVAVVRFGADGAAVAQMVVAGNKDAPPGQIFRQRLVAVNKFHHAVGQLQNRLYFTLRHTAEGMQVRPGTVDGTVKSIIWLIAEPPFCVFYSAPILRRQAGQMQ